MYVHVYVIIENNLTQKLRQPQMVMTSPQSEDNLTHKNEDDLTQK